MRPNNKVVKVIWEKSHIASAHGWFIGIQQVAPVCTSSKKRFLGPIRAHNLNGTAIGSAVFAQLTTECRIVYNGPPLPPSKLFLAMGDSDPI